MGRNRHEREDQNTKGFSDSNDRVTHADSERGFGSAERDETDPITHKPVGRMIREGFDLLAQAYDDNGD